MFSRHSGISPTGGVYGVAADRIKLAFESCAQDASIYDFDETRIDEMLVDGVLIDLLAMEK